MPAHDWSLSVMFAITITGSKWIKQFVLEKQNQLMIAEIKQRLEEKKSLQLSLVCELTQSGDVHYHGFAQIRLDPKIKKLPKYQIVDCLRAMKCCGFNCVKLVEDYYGWLAYCEKDKQTSIDCNLPHVVIDQLGIWEEIPGMPTNKINNSEVVPKPDVRKDIRPVDEKLTPQQILDDLDNN